MTLKVWSSFAKKRNSTKQPTGGVTVDAVLKEPTSLENPVFQLSATYWDTNYVEFKGSYYFVEDCVYLTNDIVEISCKLDSLATYKSAITTSTQIVERSASQFNADITDNMNSPTLDFVQKTTEIEMDTMPFTTNGCYILTVAGSCAQAASGATTTYALRAGDMLLFVNDLYAPTFLQAIMNEFNDPMSAIVKCIWLPIDYNSLQGVVLSSIMVGSTSLGQGGKLLGDRFLTWNTLIDSSALYPNYTPIIGYDFTQENYFQLEPYSHSTIYLPFVGVQNLQLFTLYKTDRIIRCALDVFTGDVIYTIGNTTPIATFCGNCSVEVPVAANNTNYKNQLMVLTQFIGMGASNIMFAGMPAATPIAKATLESAAAGNFVGNTLSRALVSEIGALGESTQTNGTLSSGVSAYINLKIVITVITQIPTMAIDEMNDLYGRPIAKKLSLSALSGYTKCNGACIELACDYNIRKEIEYFLDTGFYIE